MKIVILGGFLGAGKTTVLVQFAKHLISSSDKQTPVVILENEISEAGVDNQLLTREQLTVKNIFSGCICCSSTYALEVTAQEIEKTYDPDWLLIEATGVAFPDAIRSTLRKNGYTDAGILAIADAKRWNRVVKALGDFVESQLKDADVILLNKIDLVDEASLDGIREQVASYNPKAEVKLISAIRPQEDRFWKDVADDLRKEEA